MARRRNVTSVVVELEKFRAGGSSEAFRDALAQIAMRLVDADDRNDFRLADGATTLGESGSLQFDEDPVAELMSCHVSPASPSPGTCYGGASPAVVPVDLE